MSESHAAKLSHADEVELFRKMFMSYVLADSQTVAGEYATKLEKLSRETGLTPDEIAGLKLECMARVEWAKNLIDKQAGWRHLTFH